MKTLGRMLAKAVQGTKNTAKTTVVTSISAVTTAKDTVVNAKSDFVAGYKEESDKEIIVLPEL